MPHLFKQKSRPGQKIRPNYLMIIFHLMLLMSMAPLIRAAGRTQNDTATDVNPFYGSLDFPRESYVPIRGDFPHVYGIHMADFNFTCSEKTIGYNDGMICKLDNSTYHMKLAVTHEIIRLPEISNLQLAASIGAIVPSVGYFLHNNSNIYIASKKIDDITFAKDFYKDYLKELTQPGGYVRRAQTQEEFTSLIREKMTDDAISQLTVLKGFIDDLTNVENWGFNSNGQLIIIDADKSPQSVNDYFDRSTKSIDISLEVLEHKKKFKYMTVNLSLKNILQMKKIFVDMYDNPLPAMRSNYYAEARKLLDTNYQALLQAYIYACNKIIDDLVGSQENGGLHIPSGQINNILAKRILEISQQNYTQFNIDDLRQPTGTEISLIRKNYVNVKPNSSTPGEPDHQLYFKILLETVAAVAVLAFLYKKITSGKPASSAFFKSQLEKCKTVSEATSSEKHGLRI
jgi:hypothetical protein